MPSQRQFQCPWCDVEHADGDALRVHLMVEHRKSELASFVERRVGEEAAREVVVR